MKIEKEIKFLDEMAYKIGNVDKYIIYVNSDDSGNIPHFHMVDSNSRGTGKKGFHTCIKIKYAEYFHHTGKEDVLDTKLRKQLQIFLQKPFRNNKFKMTNWEFIKEAWNDNNSNMNVPEDCEMPNYLELK